LIIDAVINLILGVLLLLLVPFPEQLPRVLGVPKAANPFYPSVFGAVLLGIGIALLIEIFRTNPQQLVGLGLGSAVAINVGELD
jgi:protein-S-isoprenylcysteine O-methyltransferase Ste14